MVSCIARVLAFLRLAEPGRFSDDSELLMPRPSRLDGLIFGLAFSPLRMAISSREPDFLRQVH